MGKNKKGFEMDMLMWWIIAIIVLVLAVIGYMILKNKGDSAISFIQDLFRYKGK